MNKILKRVLLIGGCVILSLILFALFVVFVMWLESCDIIGLTLYKDQPIKRVFTVDEKTFLVTEDNEVFVVGGNNGLRSRKYLNTLSYLKKNGKFRLL